MTPGEVNGLQSLAMAHGGSLSINPQTGLPEAGFLKSLLPMAIGFGLAPFTGGMSAALITGAGYTAATGSLKKGIMAGLGAYGGAGLASGLTAMGAPAVAPAQAGLSPAVAANTSTAAANNIFANVGSQPLTLTDDILAGVAKTPVAPTNQALAFKSMSATPTPGMTSATLNQTPVFDIGKSLSAQVGPAPSVLPGVDQSAARIAELQRQGIVDIPFDKTSTFGRGTAYRDMSLLRPADTPAVNQIQNLTTNTRPVPYSPIGATDTPPFASGLQGTTVPSGAVDVSGQTISRPVSDYMSQLGRGAKASFSSMEGLKGLYNAMPQGSVIASGLTLAEAMKPKPLDEKKDKSLIRPYDFEYNPTGVASEPYSGSGERLYFNPTFTARTPYEAPGPEYAANGGLMGYAVGGPVERMSAMNSVGMNTGYPMANINTPTYTNSAIQDPEATNIIAPSADVGVGAYTGEERFRSGGSTKEPESSGYKYDYNPQTMQFTQLSSPTPKNPFGLMARAAGFSQQKADEFGNANRPQTTPNGTVTGGMAQPIMQPQSPAQPLIPNINIPAYQTPEQQLGLGGFYDYMGQQMGSFSGYAAGGNVGGISHLGDYSDGGRLLKGPGDGVSDSIPASIGNRQPARLADGEFVVPARIVSEIGNGSTEAGARKLYAMMDRVQRARRKTTGKGRVAVNTKSEKLLPA
jgi:hypothetical protein